MRGEILSVKDIFIFHGTGRKEEPQHRHRVPEGQTHLFSLEIHLPEFTAGDIAGHNQVVLRERTALVFREGTIEFGNDAFDLIKGCAAVVGLIVWKICKILVSKPEYFRKGMIGTVAFRPAGLVDGPDRFSVVVIAGAIDRFVGGLNLPPVIEYEKSEPVTGLKLRVFAVTSAV